MTKREMMKIVYSQLDIDYNCNPEDFNKDGVIFTIAEKQEGRREMPFITHRLEIITMGKSVIVNVSKNMMSFAKRKFEGKSNYDILGNHIRLIDTRNRESITDRVLGINIDKFFMPSVANVIGTDLSKYKLITKGKFACNPMHVGRDERLPVALYDEEEPAIVSPAYFMFEVVDNSILNEDYLMMWFRRPEFDRICWLHTDGSVRGGITWDDICRLELPIPPIEKQFEIVNSYKAITERIALKQKINDNLAA